MSLSKIAKRILNPNYRALHEAGYISDDLKITDDGKQALHHVLLEKFENELAEAAKDLIERGKADK